MTAAAARLAAVLLLLPGAAAAYPGPYPGCRIMGGGDVCAVFGEGPERRRGEELGVTHLYVGGYADDYVEALFPSFGIGGAWEDVRGTSAAPRPRADLRLGGGALDARAGFRSILDPEIEISTRVFSTPRGAIVFEASIQNRGDASKEVVVRPVVRFRVPPRSVDAWEETTSVATARFDRARIEVGFVGDEPAQALRPVPGVFPGVERIVAAAPGSVSRTAFVVHALPADAPPPAGVAPTFDAARTAWEVWLRTAETPPIPDTDLRAAFTATLLATAATSLRGAVPADMTGQFVTDGRPQLYPRDALMTARALLEAGRTEMAASILGFWDSRIPQKSPGEWYARYDAFARATPGGSGAAYDVPEWDSNGYYATLMLLLLGRTGEWHGDYALMKSLLDFAAARLDAEGLLEEGGIVEWVGRLPATQMNVAAAMRHGALLCEIRGEPVAAARYRAAAGRMERGLGRLFDPARGAYMDLRGERAAFNTSANFGYVWGFPDHLPLALTNAWYRGNAVQLGGGVQYFEAEGYGDDCFGFTTGAAARYHAEAGDPEAFREHLRWMLDRSNAYGMMPERVHFPGGADVSEASPLSWCNAEFAAAVLAGARAADPAVGAGETYALSALGREAEAFGRIVRALPRSPTTDVLVGFAARADSAARAEGAWENRMTRVRAAIDAMRDAVSWRPEGTVLEDLRPFVDRLRLLADRIVWNRSGAALRVSTGAPHVVAGDDVRLSIGVSGDAAWEDVALEWLDGNAEPKAQTYPIPPDASDMNVPVPFAHGAAPYATAVRVTARGRWKGIPMRFARTLPLRVVEPFEVEVSEEGDRIVAGVRQNDLDPPAEIRFEAPVGWTSTEILPADGARRFHLAPPADAAPGRYDLALVARGEGGREARRPFRVSHRSFLPLEGRWRFRTGDDSTWAAPLPTEAGWEEIAVPSEWEKAGHPGYDGFAWYRTEVVVPEAWRGRGAAIVLGAVDDEDWTFWNGREIGRTSVWNETRRYVLPAAEIRYGAPNLLAVRVRDGGYGGGIWRAPVRLEILDP